MKNRQFNIADCKVWPEARIVAEPLRDADAVEPRILVERRDSGLMGPGGEELCYWEGRPAISLFTGAGGMDIGLEQAGFVTAVQHEKAQAACQTLIANRPAWFRHAALIQGDIFKTPTSMLLGAAHLRVGEADLLCGGPPCQGFSTSSTKAVKGESDARNDLVFEFLRVVREAQPKFFIFENVPGFVSFKGKIEGRSYLETFLHRAHDCYYELTYGLIDAVDYGVPQRRCRFICSGTRRDLHEIEGLLAALPEPHCFGREDLNSIKRLIRLGDDDGLRSLKRAPGIRFFADREVLIPPAPNYGDHRSPGFIKFYDRLERDEPDRLVHSPINERKEVAA